MAKSLDWIIVECRLRLWVSSWCHYSYTSVWSLLGINKKKLHKIYSGCRWS